MTDIQYASNRSARHGLAPTPHPPWVEAMLAELQTDWDAVLGSRHFAAVREQKVSDETLRRSFMDFFCIVEAFPRYMGACLARTTFGLRPGDLEARNWLIGNIRTEASHAQWYLDWAMASGVTYEEIVTHRPGPEAGALYEYLWSVSNRGTLAEAFGAVNYAIEGVTGQWSRLVLPAVRHRLDGNPRALRWLEAHAEYDDAHPREALELVKLTAGDDETREKAKFATRRSLQLFRRALDALG